LNRASGSGSGRRAVAALAALALLSVGLTLGGCAASTAGDEEVVEGYPTDEQPRSSIELIDTAVTSGMLDYSTGLLYKVYVMFSPEDLPAEYRSDVPSKCGTPVILEVQRNWGALSPPDRVEISQYVQPPGDPDETGTQLDDVTSDRRDRDRDELD
jgi:hypothetical protein